MRLAWTAALCLVASLGAGCRQVLSIEVKELDGDEGAGGSGGAGGAGPSCAEVAGEGFDLLCFLLGLMMQFGVRDRPGDFVRDRFR